MEKVDITAVLSQDVKFEPIQLLTTLKCPFCEERDVFTVNTDKGRYYCFNCGVYGDSIQYLIYMKGMSFHQAVNALSSQFESPLEAMIRRHEGKKIYE